MRRLGEGRRRVRDSDLVDGLVLARSAFHHRIKLSFGRDFGRVRLITM